MAPKSKITWKMATQSVGNVVAPQRDKTKPNTTKHLPYQAKTSRMVGITTAS